MTQEQLETYLGRSLTSKEATNITTYLDIAKEKLEDLLCVSLCCDDAGTRIFQPRDGMSTVFTGIFTDIDEVRVDGEVVTDYHTAFWDNRNGSYFNSVVFDEAPCGDVEIDASWGFNETPSDLGMLWAQLFANVSKKYRVGGGNITSKQVRNFRVTFGNLTDDEEFTSANARTIKKYSMCHISHVLHGEVCNIHRSYTCGCI